MVLSRHFHRGLAVDDLGAARIAKLRLQLGQVVANQVQDLDRVGEQVFQLLDYRQRVFQLLQNLLPFQRGQPTQREIGDRLGLRFGDLEPGDQGGARRWRAPP